MVILAHATFGFNCPLLRRRYLLTLAISILSLTTTAQVACAFKLFPDVGKSIEKSVQDVGKSIEKGAQDVGKSVGNTSTEIEQSPSDPCQINSKLPQCDLNKVEK